MAHKQLADLLIRACWCNEKISPEQSFECYGRKEILAIHWCIVEEYSESARSLPGSAMFLIESRVIVMDKKKKATSQHVARGLKPSHSSLSKVYPRPRIPVYGAKRPDKYLRPRRRVD